ncbi:thiamine ABC transporter substrate binding subunit [Balneatrix alpica]|uniref:Thiamine ABC transporter substrate binding subunit n=1 Tax=Balneatrix alpica TaxID=75684 RepID=A0ABV5ZAW3_9GAMM|nr:thiamine ABC transporter substrate binding subunit [Balneatrix alpica]
MSGRALSSWLLASLLAGASTVALAANPTLTVYTYDSFTAEWGPGPKIKAAFEAECNCTLEFVAMEDAVGILQRLRLEGESTQADVVLGLDMNLMAEAKSSGLLATNQVDTSNLKLPLRWQDDTFVPYDWGYFAFVYDTEKLPNPPKSLQELVDAPDDLKIIIQDPRTSTPGLGLLLWVQKVYGDQAPEAWAKLSKKTLAVTKGWSEAYFSLFMNGEAPMVLSYSTSPAYHMEIDKTDKYQAAAFSEGHYMQVEVAAKVAVSKEAELAERFLAFTLSPAFQQQIPLGNVMYPVVDLGQELPQAFSRLIQPSQTLVFTPEEVHAQRKAWVDAWLEASSR